MSCESFSTLQLSEPTPGVLLVTLSRPERLNAIDNVMVSDLLKVVTQIEQGYPERYRAVVLRGAGRAFCSGGDLQAFQAMVSQPKDVLELYIGRFHWFSQRWYNLPTPTIAAMQGAAAGGGAALALLCDLRLATPTSRINFAYVHIGLIPDLGSHYLLPRLAGEAKALELMYTGDTVEADEALRIGLVNRIVDETALELEAIALATRLASSPPVVLRSIKHLVRETPDLSLAQVLAEETTRQAQRFHSPEFSALVRRFLSKA